MSRWRERPAVLAQVEARGAALPVHHTQAAAVLEPLLTEVDPVAVVHLGLAGGRARIALERLALNVMDYPFPDVQGVKPHGDPCVPGSPAAYGSPLPLPAILEALNNTSPGSRESAPRTCQAG